MSTPDKAPLDLDALWIDIDEEMSDDELIVLARSLYDEHCVGVAKAGKLVTHDGIEVNAYPYDDHFVHAFFTAKSKDRYGIAEDVIDARRVARVRWIAPIIAGLIEGIEGTKCYLIREHWSPRKPPPEKGYMFSGRSAT